MNDIKQKESVKSFWNNSPCGIRGITIDVESKEFFDEVERKRYELEPFLPKIVQFNRWNGKRILEVGCGIGTDFIQFVRAGSDITGIDFSERSVELTKKRLKIYGFDESRVLVADAENMPFDKGTFDLVYSWGVLHHTTNIEKAISEICRVLKPDGEICIMLYNRKSLVALQLYILHGILKLKPFHNIKEILANHLESPGTKAFTRKEVIEFFKDFHNVTVEHIVTKYDFRFMRGKNKKDYFLPYWLRVFVPKSLGWYLVIKANK